MSYANAVVSAVLNVILLGGIPFLAYATWRKTRHAQSFRVSAERAGLVVGNRRYLAYSAIAALVVAVALTVLPLPIESFTGKDSPQHQFVGLGFTTSAVVLAFLYGVVKTGFPEELLFRGLIGGSLARRFPDTLANLIQAAIFLAPHLLILRMSPELWPVLIFVFSGALFNGWLRNRSGSILGPWLVHSTANVVICLLVASRTQS